MDVQFDIDPGEFQERKRRRIAALNTAPPPPKVAPVSAPGIHEIATFLPGRLEFEHELDNDAEDLVKDLEFGICLEFGGDSIIEDENDLDVRGRLRCIEERRTGITTGAKAPHFGKKLTHLMVNGLVNGYHAVNGDLSKSTTRTKTDDTTDNVTTDGDAAVEEITLPPPIETEESIAFKLTTLEMYMQRVEKRRESKAIMFDRGLLEYKKVGLV
jgi:transcriptional adapter 2-alpha